MLATALSGISPLSQGHLTEGPLCTDEVTTVLETHAQGFSLLRVSLRPDIGFQAAPSTILMEGLTCVKPSEGNASERLREHKQADLQRGVKKTEEARELGCVKHDEFIYAGTSRI